ncbi:MAG: copper transporter [Armatimonadota bacterium]
MLIDLRSHIITLVSVFLALAVGIVVGSSFITGSSIEGRIAGGLEQEFGKLRTENQEKQAEVERLKAEIKRQTEFDAAIAPSLVKGKLAWRYVAIIQTGDYGEATESVKSALEQSGAVVTSVTVLSNLEPHDMQERAGETVKKITGADSAGDPVGRVLGMLANCAVTGKNGQVLKILDEDGLVSNSGDYSRAGSVVLVGGNRTARSRRAQKIDLVLIDKLKEAGAVRVVGVEPVDAETSYIHTYRKVSVPTVDNVDRPMGQVSLVYALAGEIGNFGVKETADRAIPAALEKGDWRSGYRR